MMTTAGLGVCAGGAAWRRPRWRECLAAVRDGPHARQMARHAREGTQTHHTAHCSFLRAGVCPLSFLYAHAASSVDLKAAGMLRMSVLFTVVPACVTAANCHDCSVESYQRPVTTRCTGRTTCERKATCYITAHLSHVQLCGYVSKYACAAQRMTLACTPTMTRRGSMFFSWIQL